MSKSCARCVCVRARFHIGCSPHITGVIFTTTEGEREKERFYGFNFLSFFRVIKNYNFFFIY